MFTMSNFILFNQSISYFYVATRLATFSSFQTEGLRFVRKKINNCILQQSLLHYLKLKFSELPSLADIYCG